MDVDVPNSIGFKRAISINVFIRPITFQGWVVALGSKGTPKTQIAISRAIFEVFVWEAMQGLEIMNEATKYG